MKLNLLFIAMDILTVMAYPVVYVYAGLRKLSKFRQDMLAARLLVPSPVTTGE